MPTFTTVPIQEVVPKSKHKGPSQRDQTREQYQSALQKALDYGQALVIELEPEDKQLTIRNRINRAAEALGQIDITIRRRKNRIVAYRAHDGGDDS
jgi:hypothetical protein